MSFIVEIVSKTTNLVFDPHFEKVRGGVEPWLMARWKARVDFLLTVIELFLANVNSRSRSLYAVASPSVVGNARAPYSADCNFRQYFYGVRYLGHPLTSTENFTEIVPREPLRRGS